MHEYRVSLEWTGNRGTGTSGYRDYGRQNIVRAEGQPDLPGTADPAFRGDHDRWNPEQLLLAARALADQLHEEASRLCFIARSVAFPVRHEPPTLSA